MYNFDVWEALKAPKVHEVFSISETGRHSAIAKFYDQMFPGASLRIITSKTRGFFSKKYEWISHAQDSFFVLITNEAFGTITQIPKWLIETANIFNDKLLVQLSTGDTLSFEAEGPHIPNLMDILQSAQKRVLTKVDGSEYFGTTFENGLLSNTEGHLYFPTTNDRFLDFDGWTDQSLFKDIIERRSAYQDIWEALNTGWITLADFGETHWKKDNEGHYVEQKNAYNDVPVRSPSMTLSDRELYSGMFITYERSVGISKTIEIRLRRDEMSDENKAKNIAETKAVLTRLQSDDSSTATGKDTKFEERRNDPNNDLLN